MSSEITFKHVTAMQRFSLAGEQELFEKYAADDRGRMIDLFQLLARAGDEVLSASNKQSILGALTALAAMGYQRESLEDGAVPIREVGLHDFYTGTELENFVRALEFSKDRIGDRALVMRAVYGQTWAQIAGDAEVTMNKARSAAKGSAAVLVRGYYASALTGCGETDQVLPRIIFGLYGDKDKKIRADVERFYAHEATCDACASVRTHLSRALTLMAAVIPPRDLTPEQSAEIARGCSLGLAVAADFERLTGAEVASPPEAAAASEPVTEVMPVLAETAAGDSDCEREQLESEEELRALATVQARKAEWPGERLVIEESELEAEAVEVQAAPESAPRRAESAPAADKPAQEELASDAGFVDPGPAPPLDLAAIEEEEMLDDNDEDGGELDLYESMAILKEVIDPAIVVPSLIRAEELVDADLGGSGATLAEPGAVFDWSASDELLVTVSDLAGEELEAAEPAEAPSQTQAEEAQVEVAHASEEQHEEAEPAPASPASESELGPLGRAEATDFAHRAVPVALVLDLATEDDAELIGSMPPPIVTQAPGAPRSVLEAAGAAGAVTFLSGPPAAAAEAAEVSDVSRWAEAGEDDQFDYDARDEQQSSRRRVAGVLLAVGAAFLLLAGITFDGGGKEQAPVAKAPAATPAPKPEAKPKAKPKKAKRKKAKRAKQAQPAPPSAQTYVPTPAPAQPQPAASPSSSSGAGDGSSEFLPEERG